jgi:hypothetical protein
MTESPASISGRDEVVYSELYVIQLAFIASVKGFLVQITREDLTSDLKR